MNTQPKKQSLPNKVKCLECDAELESKYRHDFQRCQCPNGTFVDGGQDYSRIGGMDLSKIMVWTVKGWKCAVSERTPKWYERLWAWISR